MMAERMDDERDGPSEEEKPVLRPLDYQRLGDEKYQTKTPFGIQVLAGFIAWITGLAFVVEATTGRAWGAPFIDRQDAFYCAIAGALIATGTLAIWLRVRFRWRGFLPGLLLGLGLSCLVPIGIVLIICGAHR
jgi:hypothetical protein